MAQDLVSMMDGRVIFTALGAQGGKVNLSEDIAQPAFNVEDGGNLAEALIL